MNLKASFEEKSTTFDVTATDRNAAFKSSFGVSSSGASFDVKTDDHDKAFDSPVGEVSIVHDGQNGATFTPDVSNDGVLSWTNDRDLPNPQPVNIKGPKGDKGEKGDKGDRGEQGIQGVRGEKGERGAEGARGADGTSVTHKWSGTTLHVTSASGTSFANLKGEKGDRGEQGLQGVKGEPGLRGERGLQGPRGDKGDRGEQGFDGRDGKDGYTPIKGVDYFTQSDKDELISDVISNLPVYEGSYVATPKIGEQTLPTKHTIMADDVTVKAIPFFDVSNTSGGSTVYIGNEV